MPDNAAPPRAETVPEYCLSCGGDLLQWENGKTRERWLQCERCGAKFFSDHMEEGHA